MRINVNSCIIRFDLLRHVISHTGLAPGLSLEIAGVGTVLSAGRGGVFGWVGGVGLSGESVLKGGSLLKSNS